MRRVPPWRSIESATAFGTGRCPTAEEATIKPDMEIIMTKEQSKPAPLETEPGKQKDDNIDDLGRKQDGSRQEQPGKTKPSKS